MLNKFLSKKIVLFLLLTILILISFSNYIKTNDNLLQLFLKEEKEIKEDSEEIFMAQENIEKDAKKKTIIKEQPSKNNAEKNIKELPLKIASIEEIKDPFYNEKNENNQNRKIEYNFLDLKPEASLRVLEKEITAVKAVADQKNKSSIEREDYPNEADNNKNKTALVIDLKKIELPFTLIGIVKNSNYKAALFSYQGKSVMKKEMEIINSFLIKKIESKSVIISFEGQELELKLWGADIVEKEK